MNAINSILPRDSGTGGTGTTGASGTNGTNGTPTTNSGLPNSSGLNNMFLQLLVAQLQNQSPLDPMDPTQFVGQLAQFSELSEVTQIEQILQQAVPTTGTGTGTGTGSGATGGAVPVNGNPVTSGGASQVPAALSSAAVAAAKAAIPNFSVPAAPILNQSIQGVF